MANDCGASQRSHAWDCVGRCIDCGAVRPGRAKVTPKPFAKECLTCKVSLAREQCYQTADGSRPYCEPCWKVADEAERTTRARAGRVLWVNNTPHAVELTAERLRALQLAEAMPPMPGSVAEAGILEDYTPILADSGYCAHGYNKWCSVCNAPKADPKPPEQPKADEPSPRILDWVNATFPPRASATTTAIWLEAAAGELEDGMHFTSQALQKALDGMGQQPGINWGPERDVPDPCMLPASNLPLDPPEPAQPALCACGAELMGNMSMLGQECGDCATMHAGLDYRKVDLDQRIADAQPAPKPKAPHVWENGFSSASWEDR